MSTEEDAAIKIWAYEPATDTWVEVQVNAAGVVLAVAP